MDLDLACLRGERGPQARVGDRGLVADVLAEERLVVLGEDLDERAAPSRFVSSCGMNAASRVPGARTVPIGDHAAREPARHRLEHPPVVGARPIDLVDEDQRRDAEPPQRAEQQRRLGLDALDGGDDEDRPVEDAEDALDLGDEVGVAGRVDEVDREVADERTTRRPT